MAKKSGKLVNVEVVVPPWEQIRDIFPETAAKVLNELGKEGEQEVKDAIRARFLVQPEAFDKAARGKKPFWFERASVAKPKAVIWGRGGVIDLIMFGFAWGGRKSQGVEVEVTRGKGFTWRHSFLATMPKGGHRGIFVRKVLPYAPGKEGRKIRELKGPSVPQMMSTLSIWRTFEAWFGARYQQVLEKVYKDEVRKRGG